MHRRLIAALILASVSIVRAQEAAFERPQAAETRRQRLEPADLLIEAKPVPMTSSRPGAPG